LRRRLGDAGAEQQNHEDDAERHPRHMRRTAAQAEVHPGGKQHQVVRPRRDHRDEGEREEGGEEIV